MKLRILFIGTLLVSTLTACGNDHEKAIFGIAASGSAIAGGKVSLKCVAPAIASSTAITAGDGSFVIDVRDVTLPCLMRLDYKDDAGLPQQLHSVAMGLGNNNITPVTELILANITQRSATAAFDGLDSLAIQGLTAAQLDAAIFTVKDYLSKLGVSTANLSADPIGTWFVAKTAERSGDYMDAVLEDLKSRLAAKGNTLSNAVDEVKRSPSGMLYYADPPLTVLLPSLTACISDPTLAGCTAVLPPLADCTLNPTLAGCTAVLPPLADCTLNPTLAGCTAVLPPLADCTLIPTLAGCTAVLPPLADCTSTPTLAGCTAVLPSMEGT
ncbi:MAG: hypothetical protein PHH91_07885 [Desulfuromonadaceae bacterium]|nr:hypothetical protein [Desulfuromonadaceae bacterium]